MYIQLQFNFDSIESNKDSSYERIFVCYTYKRRRVSNEFFMIHKRRLRRWLVRNGINIKFLLWDCDTNTSTIVVHADRELNVEFNISYTTLDEIE